MMRLVPPVQGARVPVRVWSRRAPAGAVEQLQRLASQPYVVAHVAGMPDLHMASGVAVGTVFATADVLVPVALGGDLGCGVSAVRFDLEAGALDERELRAILAGWSRSIPVGDAVHRGPAAPVPEGLLATPLSTGALCRARDRLAARHLGTLGGGNHFVELDRDSQGGLWLLVHSGSRGLGAAVGGHHVKAAAALSPHPLPGLCVGEEPGRACLADLEWALAFAATNRAALVAAATAVVHEVTGAEADPASGLDLHHNFVAAEEHEGERLWVHRKGAIRAAAGERVLIPGSMGTASYLAEGLGSAQSLRSASHGAGRVLTRREAREQIAPARFAHAMRRVVHDQRRARQLVEEAPMAYREIGEVLDDESDLVRPLLRLVPLVVLKG